MSEISNEYKKLVFLTVDFNQWTRKYELGLSG
jgi:hypothetical protein